MNMRTAQRGLTLIELVASIVIISVATIGLMAAVTAAVGRSADPMIQNQATAVGVAYMEEITLAPLDRKPAVHRVKAKVSRVPARY